MDLCFEQRNALHPLGEFVRQAEVLNEARTLAEALGDQQRLGQTLGYQANLCCILGEIARAIEVGERACAIAEEVGDLGVRVGANYHRGVALFHAATCAGRPTPWRTAIALVEACRSASASGWRAPAAVLARWHAAVSPGRSGRAREALAAGEEGLRIAQSAGHPYSEVLAPRRALATSICATGTLAQGTRVLEPGLALCRATEIRLALPYFAAFLGSAYLWSATRD